MSKRPKTFARTPGRGARAFTLLEVLIGMAILTAGILAVMAVFPSTMKGNEIAQLRTIGATLAMMKVEEIRRDNDQLDKLINAIKNLPQPTTPVQFATEPRLAYQFSNRTLLYIHYDNAGNVVDDPTDPRDDPGIPRVVIEMSQKFRPGNNIILDEYMFDK